MTCKLTINLSTGILEVEGSESLVKEIYNDFKNVISDFRGNKQSPLRTSDNPKENISEKASSPKRNAPKAQPSKSKPASDLKMLTDLNLRPKGKVSLKDFAAKYVIKTSEELTLLIVYYLKEELKEQVSQNHIYTAMKELGKKIPQHFRQTLINQKNSKNWIDVANWEDIKYTVPGMNYMEHDFPKVKDNGK